MSQQQLSTEPQVTRRCRHGQDHLYVTHPDGTELGYWDRATDESHPATPAYDDLLRLAVVGWCPDEDGERSSRVIDLFTRRSRSRSS